MSETLWFSENALEVRLDDSESSNLLVCSYGKKKVEVRNSCFDWLALPKANSTEMFSVFLANFLQIFYRFLSPAK